MMIANPFVGPTPFEPSQRNLFFGREEEMRSITSAIISRRLLLLYSPSGTGKSSLLQAGVVPLLEDRQCKILQTIRLGGADETTIPKEKNIFIRIMMSQLRERLYLEGEDSGSLENYLKYDVLKQIEDPTGRRVPVVVLIIDQFEELFTSHTGRWRQRAQFMSELAAALDACDPANPASDTPEGALHNKIALRIILSIREEYIAYLEQFYDLLPELRTSRFRLEPLRRNQALKAILNPAEKANRPFDPAFAEFIVDELMKIPVLSGADALAYTESDGSGKLYQKLFKNFRADASLEAGNRDQAWIVEGDTIEPVQLQVVCSDIWCSSTSSIITLDSLPRGWNIEAGLGRFYENALQFALYGPQYQLTHPVLGALKLAAIVQINFVFSVVHAVKTVSRYLPDGPVKRWIESRAHFIPEGGVRRWLNRDLITPMGTRAPVLEGSEHTGVPDQVVERLKQRYLLRAEPRFGAIWLELAHDRLVGPIVRSNGRWFAARNTRLAGINAAVLLCAAGAYWIHFRDEELVAPKIRAAVFQGFMSTNPDMALLLTAHSAASVQSNRILRGSTSDYRRGKTFLTETLLEDFLADSRVRQTELRSIVRLDAPADALIGTDAGFVVKQKGKTAQVWKAADQPTVAVDKLEFEQKCPLAEFDDRSEAVALAKTDDGVIRCDKGGRKPISFGELDESQKSYTAALSWNGNIVAIACREGSGVCYAKTVPSSIPAGQVPNNWSPLARTSIYRKIRSIAVNNIALIAVFEESNDGKNFSDAAYVYDLSAIDHADAANPLDGTRLPDVGADILGPVALSNQYIAISYLANGDQDRGRIRLLPFPIRKRQTPWLPDGSRQITTASGLPTALSFDKSGRYLAAASHRPFISVWDFGESPFGAKEILKEEFGATVNVTTVSVFDEGRTVALAGATLPKASGSTGDQLSNAKCFAVRRFIGGNWSSSSISGMCSRAWPSFGESRGWMSVSGSTSGRVMAASGMSFSDEALSPLLVTSETTARPGDVEFQVRDVTAVAKIGGVAVSASGKNLAVGRADGEIELISTERGKQQPEKVEALPALRPECAKFRSPITSSKVTGVTFSPINDDEVVAVDADGCIARFSLADNGSGGKSWQQRWSQDMAASNATIVSYSPNGRWIAVGTQDGRVFVWDRNDDSRPPAIENSRMQWIAALSWVGTWEDGDRRTRPLLVANARWGPIAAWSVVVDPPEFASAPVRAELALGPVWLDPYGIAGTAAYRDQLFIANTKGVVWKLGGLSNSGVVTDYLVTRACSVASQAAALDKAAWRQGLSEAWDVARARLATEQPNSATQIPISTPESIKELLDGAVSWLDICHRK